MRAPFHKLYGKIFHNLSKSTEKMHYDMMVIQSLFSSGLSKKKWLGNSKDHVGVKAPVKL